jgi:hypothetical protein
MKKTLDGWRRSPVFGLRNVWPTLGFGFLSAAVLLVGLVKSSRGIKKNSLDEFSNRRNLELKMSEEE